MTTSSALQGRDRFKFKKDGAPKSICMGVQSDMSVGFSANLARLKFLTGMPELNKIFSFSPWPPLLTGGWTIHFTSGSNLEYGSSLQVVSRSGHAYVGGIAKQTLLYRKMPVSMYEPLGLGLLRFVQS